MRRSSAPAALLALFSVTGAMPALADVATFAASTVTLCPACTATDSTGLKADALGHAIWGYPGGWDVWSNATDHLVVANGTGVDFSVPGTTFDLGSLKIFGLSQISKTTVPLTYNIAFYHPGNPTPDVIPFTIPARVVSTVNLSGYTQSKNLVKASISYPASSYIGKTYYIETSFTKH